MHSSGVLAIETCLGIVDIGDDATGLSECEREERVDGSFSTANASLIVKSDAKHDTAVCLPHQILFLNCDSCQQQRRVSISVVGNLLLAKFVR
jgi:hypothetical protein